MNVQIGLNILRTFVTHPLVHIHQKKKIALYIAASVNGPLKARKNQFPVGQEIFAYYSV
jgi:hypothetical protein